MLKVLKTLNSIERKVICSSKILAINDCLKMKVYTSELLNLSIEKMNSIVEDIIDLLQQILGKLPLGKFSPIKLSTGAFPHGKFPPGIFSLMFFIISTWVF